MPGRAGELAREHRDGALLRANRRHFVVKFAVIQIQEALAVSLHQDRRISIQPGVIQVELRDSARDRHSRTMLARDKGGGSKFRQFLPQRGALEERHKKRDFLHRQRRQKSRIEMIAMLVAHIDEHLLVRIPQFLPDFRSQMMVARKLKPRGIERPFGREPRVCDQNRLLGLN